MILRLSLAFEEIEKSPGSRLLRLVYNVKQDLGVWGPFLTSLKEIGDSTMYSR